MEELTDPATARDIAERDWHRCVRCAAGLVAGPRSVHHRVLGNRADRRAANLILLCGSGTTGCHGWVHANPRLARLAGWIVSRHADPVAAPVYYNQPGRTGWQVLVAGRADPDLEAGPPPLECLPDAA